MALRFTASDSLNDLYIDSFGGVDFSTAPSKVSLNRSTDAKNMIMNKSGFLEKRCGYKKVFEGDGEVNGIFEYIADTDEGRKQFYFVHRKDKLYRFELDGDSVKMHETPALEGLENTKTRSFFMGGAMFIIGAGRYIKIMYDKNFGVLAYGFVDECDTATEVEPIIENRTVGELDGDAYDYNAKHLFLSVSYKNAECDFSYSDDECSRFYIAPPEAKNIRVVCAYIDGTRIDDKNISVGADEKGIYARISYNAEHRPPYDMKATCSVRLVISSNNFVYTPTVITGRKNFEAENNTLMYAGTVVESVNLAGGKRAIEISYEKATESGTSYAAIEGEIKMITAVYFNGVMLHGGAGNLNGESAGAVYYYGKGVAIKEYEIPEMQGTLRIEYIIADTQADKINRCSVFGLFGGENDTRVFLAGDSKHPETDYASGLYEATYFPDTGYTKVGADSSAIVGYHKLYSNQIIIKDGAGADASQYIRKFAIDGSGKAYFPVSQGALSYGASNISSFKTVSDMPMFAGPDGVFSIEGTEVENQNNTICRSELINARLRRENTEKAVCVIYDSKYHMYLPSEDEYGGGMYIFDTKNGEWFYFADLPGDIRCLWVHNDRLYFGRANGEICAFLKETEDNAYYDNVGIDGDLDDARPIDAYWTVPRTNMGQGIRRKSILSTYAICQKYKKSGVQSCYLSDFNSEYIAAEDNSDLFYFDGIDFNRFTFSTVCCPVAINSHAKDKRLEVFGMKLKNDRPGEPFGLLGFGIRYRTDRYIK